MILMLTQDNYKFNFSKLQNSNDYNIIKTFIKDFCDFIIKDISLKRYPELISLAYWFNRLNLKQFIENNIIYVPRGIVFHLAPSNVDSIFIYSWFISLLCGNSNIIRISSKKSEQVDIILSIIDNLFSLDKYKKISDNNIIVKYDHNKDITDYMSSICDVRVIWGGDETINKIKQSQTKSNCKDLCFYDRFSYSVIDSKSYYNLSNREKDNIIDKYYNDVFSFNQLACSSSKVLFWVGDDIIDFYNRLENKSKEYHIEPNIVISKENFVYSSIINNEIKSFLRLNNSMFILEIDNFNITRNNCGGGVLFVKNINSIYDIINFVEKKDQTLSYFGFDFEEIKEFAVKLNGKGIDRFVKIGNSNNFNYYWDGFDLFKEMQKLVYIS